MKKSYILLFALTLVLFTACVDAIDVTSCVDTKLLGFWHGLWHGIIAPINLVAMIFNEKYAVFAANNNGAWYAFGFILGSGGWGFLGAHGKKKR